MTIADSPVEQHDGQTVIRDVLLASSAKVVDLHIDGSRISQVIPRSGVADWVALPPLFDAHVHANRSYTLDQHIPASFADAVRLTLETFAEFSADQYESHARRLFVESLRHGTTGLRTHADIDPDTQLRAVQGTLRACAEFEERMRIDVVAFTSNRADPADATTKNMLREAVSMGCAYLGAVPAFYPDPNHSIDELLELAIDLRVMVDVHQDEHLNVNNTWCEYLADAVIANDYRGRLCLSHGCVLSILDAKKQYRVIDKLLAAQVVVVCLPLTNLYLQDRGAGTPARRGLTAVHELLAAGVPLRFGSDNVRDAFYPYGNADLLTTAYVAMLAAQLDDSEALTRGICDGVSEPQPGGPADFVLVKGSCFNEILSTQPARRILFRNGLPVDPVP